MPGEPEAERQADCGDEGVGAGVPTSVQESGTCTVAMPSSIIPLHRQKKKVAKTSVWKRSTNGARWRTVSA